MTTDDIIVCDLCAADAILIGAGQDYLRVNLGLRHPLKTFDLCPNCTEIIAPKDEVDDELLHIVFKCALLQHRREMQIKNLCDMLDAKSNRVLGVP